MEFGLYGWPVVWKHVDVFVIVMELHVWLVEGVLVRFGTGLFCIALLYW